MSLWEASSSLSGRMTDSSDFFGGAAGTGLNRYSRFTEEGAGILDDEYLPGKHFTNPTGNFGMGLNLSWQLDIYRQLRNARDAAARRYIAAYEQVTGKFFAPDTDEPNARIRKNLGLK